MRKLISIIISVTCMCFAQEFEFPEYAPYIPNPYDRFSVEVNGIQDHRAYIRCPESMLTNSIPEWMEWSQREDGSQKTLKEFVGLDIGKIYWTLENGDVFFKLSAVEYPVGRLNPIDEADMALWEEYLTPFGLDPTTWKTEAEAIVITSNL